MVPQNGMRIGRGINAHVSQCLVLLLLRAGQVIFLEVVVLSFRLHAGKPVVKEVFREGVGSLFVEACACEAY